MTSSSTDLSALKVEDEAWVINSFRTRVFLCRVVEIRQMDDGAELIIVQNVDKSQKQAFSRDGKPFKLWGDPPPQLVPYDNEEALALEDAALHREYRERVNQILRRLPDDPSGFNEARAVLSDWEALCQE